MRLRRWIGAAALAWPLAACTGHSPEVVITDGFVAIVVAPSGTMAEAAAQNQPFAAIACRESGQGPGAQFDHSSVAPGRWTIYYLCG